MKKHLALVLALVMVLGSFSFVSAAPDFSDVKGTSFEDAVNRLESLNVLKGYPDGTFKPADTITRAEFAAVAVRVSGLEQAAMSAKGLPTGFSDVPAWHWASGYVGTAAKLGIVQGVGNGMFAPETPVKYEEAVTMLVRALGYEPSAAAKGGYPFGYLIVANETDLLDGALGTQGTWATRGFVAKIADNALEIPMMVQIGYGTESRFEVSTKDNGGVKYLFDKMGFDTFEGRVTSFNDSKNKITIKGDDNATLDVAEDFDFYEVYGVTTKFWAKSDKVVAYALQDDVMFDAVEADDDELYLVEEDDNYDIAKDASFLINDKKANLNEFTADYVDYAKVVFDDDGDVVWVQGYTFDDFLVFEKADGNILSSYGEELNTKDYTITKDGETIKLADLEKGDVVFYNTAQEFANVYNNAVEGEISRIYTNKITVDGSDYKYNGSTINSTKYINEDGDLVKFTDDTNFKDIVEAMEEEGDVKVFLDRQGNMVFIVGDLGDLITSSSYVMVTKTSKAFNNRGTTYWTLDVINAAGEVVKYDIDNSDVNSVSDSILKDKDGRIVWTAGGSNVGDESTKILRETVLELSIDKDGDVTEIVLLDKEPAFNGNFKVTNNYYNGLKIDASAPVFIVEDYNTDVKDIKVIKYSELDFDFIKEATFFKDGTKVVSIVVDKSDREEEVTTHLTVATADQDKVSGKNIWRLKLVIDGAKKSFDTKEDIAVRYDVKKGDLLEVKIDDNTGKINELRKVIDGRAITADVVSDRTSTSLKINGVEYKLGVDAVVVDATDSYKVISLSNIKNGDYAKALVVSVGSKYAEVIVKTAKAGEDSGTIATDGTVTYIDPAFAYVIIDGKEIDIIGNAAEFFAKGAVTVGKKIAFDVTSTNKMYKITAIDGNVTFNATGYSAFSDLVVGGNLTFDGAFSYTASNVTVKGNLVVGSGGATALAATNFDVTGTTTVNSTAAVTFNSELNGKVTVTAAGASSGFTNVKFGGDVEVNSANVTIKNSTIAGDFDAKGKAVVLEGSVTVKGAIKDAGAVNATAADQDIQDAVQDAKDEAAHADKLNSTSMTNFNTHSGADYKGVNIGFTLQNGIDFDKISSIKVNLYSTEGTLIASNVAIKNKIKDLYTAQTPVREFSTAFIAEDGTYEEEYWTLGAWTAKANVKPAKAELVIVDSKGNEYKKVNNSLSEDTATWSSLF